MNVFSVNPYIRVALRRSTLRAHSKLRRRIIFDYELLYVEAGRFLLMYDGREYPCEVGTFVLLRPGVEHSFFMGEEGLVQPHIHFDLAYAADSRTIPVSFRAREEMEEKELHAIREDAFAAYGNNPIIRFSRKEEALSLFYSVLEIPHGAAEQLEQKAAMIRLINMLAEDNFPGCFARPRAYAIEHQIKDYIDARPEADITLARLAEQFSYSKFYIEKKFQAAYGEGIMAYRNRKRMEAAQKLLPTASVTEVAQQLGYHSIYSFSRAFKNFFGYPPSNGGRG